MIYLTSGRVCGPVSPKRKKKDKTGGCMNSPILELLENSFASMERKLEADLGLLEQERDFLVGRMIAEETKEYNLSEFEKLGLAFRWYKWKNKELVRKGYRFQLSEMFDFNMPKALKDAG